jgi:outer membrane autotransporter protein
MTSTNTNHRKLARWLTLALTTTALVGIAVPTAAMATEWTGAVSADWSDPANWTAGVPTSADQAGINTIAPNSPVIAAAGAQAQTTVVGGTAEGMLQIIGGTLSDGRAILGNDAGVTGWASVDGAGASWTTTGETIAGFGGNGGLLIKNGGAVSNATTTLASTVGSVGEIGVHGNGSTLTSSGAINVGFSGQAGLFVSTGGKVQSGDVYLGLQSGSVGSANVTDAGSSWTSSSNFTVGLNGLGELNISNGGLVTNVTGMIAGGLGSIGDASVDGAGSTWTNTGALYVSYAGAGTLSVTDGGLVNSVGGYIGLTAEGTGEATIDGANSAWMNSADLTVGYSGIGSLQITDGGHVGNVTATIGSGAGSVGEVDVDGAGSQWINTGSLNVGYGGDGTLYLSNGALVQSANAYIGMVNGSTGLVSVSGDANWTNADSLSVGYSGDGTLEIALGGKVSDTVGYIAAGQGGVGLVTVGGVGSTWTNSGDLYVGAAGSGELHIVAGGLVTNVIGQVGQQAGSSGLVTVEGPGSIWTNSGPLYVGTGGQGIIAIADGGVVNSGYGHIGIYAAGGDGAVTVDGVGSAWHAGLLDIGVSGVGLLEIAHGGAVTTAGRTLAGLEAGGSGSIVVDGVGSSLAVTGSLGLGALGDASLTISEGGKVANTTATLGYAASSSGAVTVDGVGSEWTNSAWIAVGSSGDGTLAISGGGVVRDTSGYIAVNAGSTGLVTVDGAGSAWINSADLMAGGVGLGELAVTNGGVVTNANGFVGYNTGSHGIVTVGGTGSTWSSTGDVIIGFDGDGRLVTANGGSVVATGAIVLAANAGSTGVLDIGGAAGSAAQAAGTIDAAGLVFGNGSATLNFNHDASGSAYVFDTDMTGLGVINQVAGYTNLTGGSNGFIGATNVLGGRLAVNGTLGNSVVTVSNGAALSGNGLVGGIVAQAGSVVAPGNSIGTLQVNGNVSFASGSTYQVELTSTGQSDLIVSNGTATVAGGAIINLVKMDAAPYVLGAHYTVLAAAGGVTGNFTLVGDTQINNFVGVIAGSDATSIFLDIGKIKTFASVGQTFNQASTGAGADSLPLSNGLVGVLVNLPTDTAAAAAFDQLSGEGLVSLQTGLIEDSRFVREAALGRLNDASDDRRAAWGQAFGSWGSIDGDGNAAEAERSTGGMVMGVDVPLQDGWRLGLLGGYSRTRSEVSARASVQDSDSYHLGAYAGGELGPVTIRFGAAQSWHDIDGSRSVAFAGLDERLTVGYRATTTQAFAEVGHRFEAGAVSLEPFASLAYVDLSTKGFEEKGGLAALNVDSGSNDVLYSTVGLRAARDFAIGGDKVVKVKGSLGWLHGYGSAIPEARFAFDGGDAFTVKGLPLAQDSLLVDAEVRVMQQGDLALSVSYSGQLADDRQSNSARINLSWKF